MGYRSIDASWKKEIGDLGSGESSLFGGKVRAGSIGWAQGIKEKQTKCEGRRKSSFCEKHKGIDWIKKEERGLSGEGMGGEEVERIERNRWGLSGSWEKVDPGRGNVLGVRQRRTARSAGWKKTWGTEREKKPLKKRPLGKVWKRKEFRGM